MRFSRGFTLIEMMVATILSAVLMLAVLEVLGGVSRDRQILSSAQAVPQNNQIVEQIRWDLINAHTMQQSPDGLILTIVGNGAIDPATLVPNNRLARVTYRCQHDNAVPYLIREQQYLDDPARPFTWRELASVGITHIMTIPQANYSIVPKSPDADTTLSISDLTHGTINRGPIIRVPARLKLNLANSTGGISEDLCIK